MCQRPKRAFFISTKGRKNPFLLLEKCQRPKRAFFISTIALALSAASHILACVNALNGLSSFLLLVILLGAGLTWVMCQRPKRAFFISTTGKTITIPNSELCQRPKRAFFISTKQV